MAFWPQKKICYKLCYKRRRIEHICVVLPFLFIPVSFLPHDHRLQVGSALMTVPPYRVPHIDKLCFIEVFRQMAIANLLPTTRTLGRHSQPVRHGCGSLYGMGVCLWRRFKSRGPVDSRLLSEISCSSWLAFTSSPFPINSITRVGPRDETGARKRW